MAEPTEENAEAGKGGKKKLLIFIILGLLVLLIAGGAGAFFFLKKDPAPEETGEEQTQMIEPTIENDIGPMVPVDEFIVNIIGEGEPHYVKASFTLELNSEEAHEEVTQRMPQIRDAVLLLIGNKTFEELQDLQGKKQVKAEMKSKINSFLKTGRVKSIYLTDFVVQ